ncbi:hypothetical protein CISG_04825 [Coccidioides immitis RMSCC 3703]|uniref:Uncharacterized protein n=2 Tax=Coccidioides immitis TaxID=5501 RepID=A0A0J8QT72_COCIT|nr:hypothetical protein CIRG_08837 [Coccidioides immitis RMSCC 2394]KMU75651.1 hypothetical protein CISG_04825 [Coccidioides immitis RMSCC 3703]
MNRLSTTNTFSAREQLTRGDMYYYYDERRQGGIRREPKKSILLIDLRV